MNETSSANRVVCFFGNYDPEYIRSGVIMHGLQANGVTVKECQTSLKGWRSYQELRQKHRQLRGSYDVLVVGNNNLSRSYVVLAKLLTRKPVIWDAHYSLYDAWVYDRGVVKRFSLKGLYHWTLDWLATTLADAVYLDTTAHTEYFIRLFHANPKKFFHVLVGADEAMFKPRESHPTKDKFVVEFHGKYIPLQGVPHIVRAAKQLEEHHEIIFKLIGGGQTYQDVRSLSTELEIKNIEFIDKVPYSAIPDYLHDADVCLGIFGDTGKTQRVIPNKLYEAVAAGRPVVTGRTPAIVEVFTDRENILLCEVSNGEDLAAKILEVYHDRSLGEALGRSVYQLYQKELTPVAITKPLVEWISKLS